MQVKELEKGKIVVEDYDSLNFYRNSDKVKESKPLNNPLLISAMNVDVDVIEPVNNGKEFLVKHISEINKNLTYKYTNLNFKDRYYGDIFPDFKDVVYPYMREAYVTGKKVNLKFYFYKNNMLKFIIDSVLLYENGEILFLHSNITPTEDTLDFDFDYFDEDHIIDYYIKSINNKESLVIIENKKNNTFNVPDEVYSLFELKKDDYSDFKSLVKDLLFENDISYLIDKTKSLTVNNSQDTLNFKVLTPKHEVKTFRCFIFGLFDKNEELENIFYFVKDITDYDLTAASLKELNNNLHAIQTLSRGAIYYFNIHGEYMWTSNIRNIVESSTFNYKSDYNIIEDLVLEEDREIYEEAFNSLNKLNPLQNFKVRIKTMKGNIKDINIILKNIYDGNNEIISSSMQVYDITKGTVESNYIRLINAFNAVSSHLKTAVIYGNGKGKFKPSNVIEDILGIPAAEWSESGRKIFIENLVDSSKLEREIERLTNHETDEVNLLLKYKFNGDPNNIKIIRYYLFRDDNNDISGYVEDITEVKEYEKHLKRLNQEKSILLKEVHHRVKNNLQVLSSLLNLEERFYKNEPEEILKSTKKRLKSIALVHEMTYGNMDMESVNLKDYFEIFDKDVYGIYSDEHFIIKNEIDDVDISSNKVTPLILIINEFVSNSIKYAFDYENNGKANIIRKTIKCDGDTCIVEYGDNGKGLPEGFDINRSGGLGWTIINSFVKQLDGEIEQLPGEGTNFRIKFPINGD